MKHIPTVLLLVLVSLKGAFTQTYMAHHKRSDERFSSKLILDDPDQVSPWYVGLDFLGLEATSVGAIGFGIDAGYLLKNRVWFEGYLYRPFFKGTDSERSSYDRSQVEEGYTIPLYRRQELGTAVYLFSFSNPVPPKRARLNIPLGFLQRATYHLETPMNRTRRMGLRGGYYGFRQSVQFGVFGAGVTPEGKEALLTGFASHAAYAGILFSSFQHLQVESEAYGTLKRSMVQHLYFDILWGLQGEQFFVAYDSHLLAWNPYEFPEERLAQNMGFRLGWERFRRHTRHARLGFRYGFECGIRPIPLFEPECVFAICSPPLPTLSPAFLSFKMGVFLAEE